MLLRIMAVDDEPAILNLVKATVEPMGIEVLTVGDAQQAAERANQEVFDGIFVDAKMPGLDGFELTRAIRKSALNPRVPIVMLTGYDDIDTMRKGYQAGVTFFLGKPFSPDRASNLVRAMRGPMLNEKRRHARLPYRTRVECKWGEHGERQFVAGSLNIGEGGMLLEPSGGLEVGDRVQVEFQMPNHKSILRPQARVVRREDPDRVAIEFVQISLEEQEAIREYIFGRGKE